MNNQLMAIIDKARCRRECLTDDDEEFIVDLLEGQELGDELTDLEFHRLCEIGAKIA